VEVNGNGKHSSLLQFGNNYSRKKFYSAGTWLMKKVFFQNIQKNHLLRNSFSKQLTKPVFLFFPVAFVRQRRLQRRRRPLHHPLHQPAEAQPAVQRRQLADLCRLVVSYF
jgi:hypothetical protein